MQTSSLQREEPVWLSNDKIDEVLFCKELLEEEPMICIHDTFFTVDGKVTDLGRLRNRILTKISPYIRRGLSRKTAALLDVLRIECYSEPLPICQDRIHVANGTLYLDGRFEETKEFCLNRLPVSYNPDVSEPTRWLQFIAELLYPEDIPTLQEYMGYCLIPSTRAQKMLMLVGKGGEGKSRVGIVLSAMLGQSMYSGSIAKVETSTFARADLEFALLMVDDDMKMEALPQTNVIKSIVTAETLMDLERKGKQSYQGVMYARLMGFGNGTLKSLYDRSLGVFRWQIILITKDKPVGRVDDPFLSDRLKEETEGIFLWSLEGLRRLIANNYRFTISDRTASNLRENITESNNVISFLDSEGYIVFQADSGITSQRLYELYRQWCEDNAIHPLSSASFFTQMAQQAPRYGLRDSKKIRNYAGREVRGYEGICEGIHLAGTGDGNFQSLHISEFQEVELEPPPEFDQIEMEQFSQATPHDITRHVSGDFPSPETPEVCA